MTKPKPQPKPNPADEILYRDPDDDFTITQADVDAVIARARRQNPELARLLEAKIVDDVPGAPKPPRRERGQT